MENYIGKYIGKKKIKSIEQSVRKTFLGKEVTQVTYEDGTKDEFPAESMWLRVTDQEGDLTQLREKVILPVVEKILAIILEAEVKIIDIEYLTQKIIMSVRDHIDRANKKLWGREYFDQTMSDVHIVLTKKDELQKKNKKSEGGGIPKKLSVREGDGEPPKGKKP